MKPPSNGPTAAAIAAAAPTSAYRPALHRPLEVAVDEGLHRGEQKGRSETSDDRPEDHDRQQGLRQRHRQRARCIAKQAEHVGALAADQVGDLAADQDEGGGDKRLEGDRRLDAAGSRVEVVHDCGDGHVHQRCVDDEDEHRHREENGESLVPAGLLCGRDGSFAAHCVAGPDPSAIRDPALSDCLVTPASRSPMTGLASRAPGVRASSSMEEPYRFAFGQVTTVWRGARARTQLEAARSRSPGARPPSRRSGPWPDRS
jgi:hypothetical protein